MLLLDVPSGISEYTEYKHHAYSNPEKQHIQPRAVDGNHATNQGERTTMTGRFSLRDLGQPPLHEAVMEYLRAHGWRTQQEGQHVRCEGPPDDEGQPIVQFLPKSERYADYPLRLEDLISVLSVIEERPAMEIVREMVVSTPATAATGGSLTEAILDELQRSARGVLSDDERQRLTEELSTVLVKAELETEGIMNVSSRAAWLVSRLARGLPDNARSQVLFGRLCVRLLAHFGLQPAGSLGDFVEFYGLSRLANPAAPDAVLTWIEEHYRPPSEVDPTAGKTPTGT